jgi:hypothetical protein
MAIKRTKQTLIGLVGAGVMAGGSLTGIGAAQAATGDCEHNIDYRISSPAKFRVTANTHTIVIGLSAPMRTVTFVANDGSGCVLETGDHWSASGGAHSKYFHAEGTYDGTADSLTDRVRVKVPKSSLEAAGTHRVTVTLDDITGTDNDTSRERSLYLRRRTVWRSFNVFPESPTPACGSLTGTTLQAEGQLFHASWTGHAYRPYKDRKVRLLFNPGNGPIAPGHTADDTVDITIANDITNADGWARFTFKPPFDATYFAHFGGNHHAGHSDSAADFVNCTP